MIISPEIVQNSANHIIQGVEVRSSKILTNENIEESKEKSSTVLC